ncbi:MAG: tRNA (adenine(22)-N(1))-methyltransferase TrmK [Bdellovibrio sp.]|jgi:tRNA A22 N-methylase
MTPRLNYLLSKADPLRTLWDVGCDHGYLGEQALIQGFPFVHFVDPADPVIQKLKRRLGFHYGNAAYHQLRGQDLANFKIEGSVVMAGFGGDQMREILERWMQHSLLGDARLILSPYKDEKKLADWLQTTFGDLISDSFVERKKTRPVLVCTTTWEQRQG